MLKGLDDAPFTGVGVALVTLVDDAQHVDVQATVAHAVKLVDLGMKAVLVGGTTGEATALAKAERNELLAAVIERVRDRAIVNYRYWAASPKEACRLAKPPVPLAQRAFSAHRPIPWT